MILSKDQHAIAKRGTWWIALTLVVLVLLFVAPAVAVSDDEWPPQDPIKLLERLRLRDAEFDRRSLQSERRWVTRVEPRTRIADDYKAGSRRLPGPRMFGRSQLSYVDKPYDQPHRVPYLVTVHGRGGGLLSNVVIDNADDLETMTDPRFEPAVKSDRWPERPQQVALNTVMMEGLMLETQQLSSTRQAFEWSTGYGFAKRIVSIDELRVKNDRVVISGKSRVFNFGKRSIQGSPPSPNHDSQYQMELDSDFIVRKAEFSLTDSPEVHQRIVPNYDHIQSILVETSGIVRPTNAPPVAAEGHYRLVVQKPDKSQHTYHNDRFTFVALSARLTDDELNQRTAPTREFYFITQPVEDTSSKNATSTVIAPADIGPEHDGKEVTMTFKITDTQLIGGERDGEFPHVKLHYDGMKKPPYLGVYVKGELADALHRFAYVSPDNKFVGRSITASGKIKMHKDFPKGEDQTPVYVLDLRDWKQFQILPEPNALSKLEGVWIAEKVTTAGEVVTKEKFPFELHFENDKLIFRFVAPSLGKDRVHELVVDETKTPATIDIRSADPRKQETVYGIYKLEGDRLLICSLRDSNRQPSKERPTTFDSSKEERSDLLVLTRKPVPQK